MVDTVHALSSEMEKMCHISGMVVSFTYKRYCYIPFVKKLFIFPNFGINLRFQIRRDTTKPTAPSAFRSLFLILYFCVL